MIAALCVLGSLLSGCAITWEKDDRVVTAGFVWLEYSKPTPGQKISPVVSEGTHVNLGFVTIPYSPTVVAQKYWGVGAEFSHFDQGVFIGYKDAIRVYPPSDGTMRLNFQPARPFDTAIEFGEPESDGPELAIARTRPFLATGNH